MTDKARELKEVLYETYFAERPVQQARLGLTPEAALDLDRVTYTALGELATATEKARRDAPAIPVCEV